MLRTKSIIKRISKTDGIRICVMRRIKPEYKFDLWLPVISPSEKLLNQYVIDQEITWEEFVPKYKKELHINHFFISLLVGLAKSKTVTLLCYENSHSRCHRSIIAEMIADECPNIVIKHC